MKTKCKNRLKKRICIVTPDFIGPIRNGGVGTACFYQAQVLSKAGHKVTILFSGQDETGMRDHWAEKYNLDYGWTYIDLNDWSSKNVPTSEQVASYPLIPQLWASRLVLEFLKKNEFEIVFFQDYLGHSLYPMQYKKAGLGLADTIVYLTIHSFQLWIRDGMRQFSGSLEQFIAQQAEIEAIYLADTLIAPSKYMADWTSAALGVSSDRFLQLPYCYDSCSKALVGDGSHTFGPFEHLVFFGRLETRKGLHFFIDAIRNSAILRRKTRKVTFIGRQASVLGINSLNYIEEVTKNCNFPQWEIIDKFNKHEALEWLKAQSKILVVAPSVSDNLPLVIIELMSARLPFISTDVGGIPEIVGPSNPHLLAKPSADGLQVCLEKVVSSGELEVDYRNAYQSDRAAEKMLDLIDSSVLKTFARSQTAPKQSVSPVVSIIIPHYESPAYLNRALATLIAQDFNEKYEIIVIDDCSSEDVWKCIKLNVERLNDSRVHLYRLAENRGPGAARNCGMKFAQGEYLVFFDADNEAMPFMLSTMIKSIRHTEAGCMTCFSNVIHQNDRFNPKELDIKNAKYIYTPIGPSLELAPFINTFGDTCSIMKASLSELVGGWSEEIDTHEDWEYFSRISSKGINFGVIPEVLYLYRDQDGARHNRLASIYEYTTRRNIIRNIIPAFERKQIPLGNILSFASGLSSRNIWERKICAGAKLEDVYDNFVDIEGAALSSHLNQIYGKDDNYLSQKSKTIVQIGRSLTKIVSILNDFNDGPRLVIYGAGEHSKVLLGLMPFLWKFLVGFIDANPRQSFMGKPCYSPDEIDSSNVDVILYSSAVHEQAMYSRTKHLSVKHILIYASS